MNFENKPTDYYIFQVPRAIIESFLYTTIIFWIVGLDDSPYRFFLFTIPIVLAANCANAYGEHFFPF